MLVLSRKEGEKLVIDGSITICIVRIEGGKIRLGIEAPSDVTIRREELQRRIKPDTADPECTPGVLRGRCWRAAAAAR